MFKFGEFYCPQYTAGLIVFVKLAFIKFCIYVGLGNVNVGVVSKTIYTLLEFSVGVLASFIFGVVVVLFDSGTWIKVHWDGYPVQL